ncbi:hypothetical protein [Alteromonas sp. a30]|uniref:hypothetical protein n=1 Tax=Alteromonas sp. a30 TaxID=2730917 RepID=UPI00227EE963|nr:hypothetical protein [Alteromonas sp. a30]MCY7296342.1 RimK-like protein [Alteromonas sp. a30]
MRIDVLLVSSIYDFSTDLVVQELEKRQVSYFRLNKEEFENYRLTIDIHEKALEIIANDIVYEITSSVKSIYFRQPVFLRNTPSSGLEISEQLSRSQWMGFLRSLVIFDKAGWINRPEAAYLAETKAYQLVVANDIGFKIPKTLIGNNANRFQCFENKVIIKSLDTILLREADECLFTYSTIKCSEDLHDENVSAAPLTVQNYVTSKIDIRVTIIGNKLIAVKITSGGKGIEEDWRTTDRSKIEYNEIQLPTDIEDKCFELLDRLNLNFGAIDLLLSNGKYTFIEVNPTGEWGWLVNSQRRFDIDIANWLERGGL